MKKLLLCLAVLMCGAISGLSAQELSVKNFELRPTDLTAKIADKKDLNGDVCAMVKIFVALRKITVPAETIVGEIETPAYSEFRVFLPAGSRRIQIHAPNFLPLEYTFPEPLETMRTYELRLSLNGATPSDPRPTYKVGDLYNVDGNVGVVFAVDPTGRIGKVLALEDHDGFLIWDDAVSYCEGIGNGWHLPSKEELQVLFNQRKELKKVFSNMGKPWLLEEPYWTGTNIDPSRMFPCDVDMKEGKVGKIHKKNPRRVRAVYDFAVPDQY